MHTSRKPPPAGMFAVLGCAGIAMAGPAGGALAADGFYAGKTLKVIIRSGAGGGNDFYGRLMARHISRFIPGTPNSIPVNMPGAGGVVAANYLHNRAKRDGTEIGILARSIAVVQRTKTKGVRYDVRNLIPLGSMASTTAVFVAARNFPVDSLRKLKGSKVPLKISATGRGGGEFQRAMVLKMDGFPIQLITGYSSTGEKVLAIARGETNATNGDYESLRSSIKEEKLKVIGKLGGSHPEIPASVPDMRDVLSPDRRKLASLLVAPLEAGRPFFIAPKVAADRVAILRAAFKQALSDSKLRAEAKKARRDVSWMDPESMRRTQLDILDASDDVMAEFKKLMK